MSQANQELEDKKSELASDLRKAKSKLRALRESESAAVARAEAVEPKILELESEIDAANRREFAAVDAQAVVVRAIAEKLLKSMKFSSLANEVAAIITASVRNKPLDAVSASYPDLDKSQFGYAVVDLNELLKSYASIILKYTGTFPIVESLSDLISPLTAEAILACTTNKDPMLKNAIADLSSHNESNSESE